MLELLGLKDGRRTRLMLGAAVAAIAAGICQTATAATLCVNAGGSSGCYTTIGAAVAAAAAGDTIQVANGTYREDVVITKSLSLLGANENNTTIDAAGKSNGIFINGMSSAPNAGVSGVAISGFTVENANFEGILIANASDVTVWGNQVSGNNKSLNTSALSCPGIPDFETNEGEDCGEGIHLMAVDHSTVANNDIENNSGGILISDETGPTHDNLITGNSVLNNPFDCGITLASHGRASNVPHGLNFGVYHNTISQNTSSHNGYLLPGAGAGVGIFAPGPGSTASGNVVVNNDLTNNGLPGVTMHNHAAFAMAPPVNMNDNVIVGNRISGNGADTQDAATSGPTGINVFSVATVTGTVISQNIIKGEAIDIAFNGPGLVQAHLNDFTDNGTGVDNLGAGIVDATENWWKCSGGPGAPGCASIAGTGVVFAPWLTKPF